ncbi:MAG: zinc-binding dehydrogenase, partial [Pseudomonadota bacterium]
LANVWPVLEAGRVRPIFDSAFSLAEAAYAHRRMERTRGTSPLIALPRSS